MKRNLLLLEKNIDQAQEVALNLNSLSIEFQTVLILNEDDVLNVLSEKQAQLIFVNEDFKDPFLLLSELKSTVNCPPVIFYSKSHDSERELLFFKNGAVDYIDIDLFNSPKALTQIIKSSLRYSKSEKKRVVAESKLIKVESRLATIISNTPIILFVLDEEGIFKIGLGKYWEDFSNHKLLLGESFQVLFNERSQYLKVAKEVLNGNTQQFKLNKEGKWYDVSLTPILDNNNKVKEILGLANEVSERVKAEDSLLEAKKIAEKAAKFKEDFIANMSHEIRTPMNAIVGFANLLLKTNLNEEQLEFIEAINISGENLLSLINDILDFSKIEAGKFELNNTEFSPERTVKDVMSVLKGKSKEKEVELKLAIKQDIPLKVFGDEKKYYQILMNLVSNALKFTQKGKVLIEVSAVNSKDNKLQISTQVTDTGIGIPTSQLDYVFGDFTQIATPSDRKNGGTGLGLSIVKKMVDFMGGTVSVDSRLNVGSTFTILLPFEKIELSDKEIDQSSQEIDESIISSVLKGKSFLLVDDNIMNQKLVKVLLNNYKVIIDTANDGVEAIEFLNQNKYDLVLMDVQMPNMDGITATKKVRASNGLNKNVPIIALTAHAFKEEVEKCTNAGMNAHIVKPVIKRLFFNSIVNILQNESKNDISTFEKTDFSDIIDIKYLNDLSNGNTIFLNEMLTIFKQDADEVVHSIELNLDQNNKEELKRLLHKFKSPVAMFGVKGLIKNIVEFEEAIEQNQSDKALLNIFDQLKRNVFLVIELIEKEYDF